MTELSSPAHNDFGQALIDAKKYGDIVAYNTGLLLHLFPLLSFEQFVNKCHLAVMKLATPLPDSIWWKDPNALPVPKEKTELVLHKEGYVQAGFFTYLLTVMQDARIPLIAAGSDMSNRPRCYNATVMNTGSSVGVQVATKSRLARVRVARSGISLPIRCSPAADSIPPTRNAPSLSLR